MRRLRQLVLALLLAAALPLGAAEVIDRIVLTVNGAAILQSDVDMALRYEAFLDSRSLGSLTVKDWQATLERLIDQELLSREMGKDFPAPAAAELADRIVRVRAQIPQAASDDGWQRALARYGLTSDEVAERLRLQMQIGRFLEQRLRPSIQVDPASVQAYYKDKLVPELKKQGIQREPPLRQVRSQIEKILVEQRLNEELTVWLRTLRQQSRIRSFAEITPPAVKAPPRAQVEPGGASN